MEKDCKWHFGNEGGLDVGPNDPIHQTFKGNPYYSIVREAIQNSLDAINDKTIPVSVSFQYFDLNRQQYPAFFQLEQHITQSQAYFKNNADAKALFGGMTQYLNGREQGMKKLKISCLKISDSNTKGMHYIDGDTESPFYAFLRATGVSAKMISGSGGSFGFGKGAYFALSPLKTLVVSSKDTAHNVYFEGATRLTTHRNETGEVLTAYGFYDNNKGKPVFDEEDVPEIFKRVGTGTDINIIGLWDESDRNRLMIKSVLNNFWLAIHDQKLIVTINDISISKENLEQIIDDYFQTEYESGSATEIESWNPKPYYKAVKYTGASPQFISFSEELETLGLVKLYVYLEKGLPNRIAFFRAPKMVVCKKTNRRINGYCAVLLCDNEKGNEILKRMENPAHNEWNKENYQEEGRPHKDAKKAEAELNNFISAKLDSLSKINSSKKVAFMDLENYLSIPEDLLEKDENSDLSGRNSSDYGVASNEISQEETGMQTTEQDSVTIKPTIKKNDEIRDADHVKEDEEGELEITIQEEGGENPPPSPGPGEDSVVGSLSDSPAPSKILRKVKLKVAVQKEQNLYYHNLIIFSDSRINNAELELLVGNDNDRDDSIAIHSTDKGTIQDNRLKNLSLVTGKNTIKIRFSDNLKHSIKLKAYETD